MLKQLIVLVVLSIVTILAISQVQYGLDWLMNAHAWIAEALTQVFSAGSAGHFAKGLIALLAIPVVVGLVPSLFYWLMKRHWFPYFMQIVWVVWLVQAGALVVMSRV